MDAKRYDDFISQKLTPWDKVLIRPHVGEFGHKINYAVRRAYFLPTQHEKVIAICHGEEVLYPNATSFDYDWKKPTIYNDDFYVVGSGRGCIKYPELENRYPKHKILDGGNLSFEEESFNPIYHDQRIRLFPKPRKQYVDVVLGCRKRPRNRTDKNWTHWPSTIKEIKKHGLTVGIIGNENSYKGIGEDLFSEDLDQSAEMIQNANCFIGTDSGSSHLAALIGTPMLVFRANTGRECFMEHMKLVNNPFEFNHVDGWQDFKAINETIVRFVNKYKK